MNKKQTKSVSDCQRALQSPRRQARRRFDHFSRRQLRANHRRKSGGPAPHTRCGGCVRQKILYRSQTCASVVLTQQQTRQSGLLLKAGHQVRCPGSVAFRHPRLKGSRAAATCNPFKLKRSGFGLAQRVWFEVCQKSLFFDKPKQTKAALYGIWRKSACWHHRIKALAHPEIGRSLRRTPARRRRWSAAGRPKRTGSRTGRARFSAQASSPWRRSRRARGG